MSERLTEYYPCPGCPFHNFSQAHQCEPKEGTCRWLLSLIDDQRKLEAIRKMGGENMNGLNKWWLISDEDVQEIKKGLDGSLLHTLESGLHKTDAIPTDFQSLETKGDTR